MSRSIIDTVRESTLIERKVGMSLDERSMIIRENMRRATEIGDRLLHSRIRKVIKTKIGVEVEKFRNKCRDKSFTTREHVEAEDLRITELYHEYLSTYDIYDLEDTEKIVHVGQGIYLSHFNLIDIGFEVLHRKDNPLRKFQRIWRSQRNI